jgi:hypothetical protein
MIKIKKISLGPIIVLAITIIAIVTVSTTFAALSVNQKVPSSGSVTVSANLGVFSDGACQNATSTINWGTPTPGTNVTRTVYIKNTGSGVSLSLSMATSNWIPENANGPITAVWNQNGARLYPGQSTPAIITLIVSPTIADITNFNVQISIIGTQ